MNDIPYFHQAKCSLSLNTCQAQATQSRYLEFLSAIEDHTAGTDKLNKISSGVEENSRFYRGLISSMRSRGRFSQPIHSPGRVGFGSVLKRALRHTKAIIALVYLLCSTWGMIAKTQGNPSLAESYFVRAAHVDPNYAEALLELASVKMEQTRYQEAIPLLQRCTQVSEAPATAYYKLALAERSLHQFEAAQRDMNVFQTLSKNRESSPYPLQHFFDFLEGRNALLSAQQVEADLHELESEVKQHPDRPRTLYLLAEALLRAGRTKDANEAIERLDEISGGDFRTELGIGILLARFRSYPAAIQHLQAAVKGDAASEEAKYNLAEVYFESGDYQAALQPLLEISSEAQKDGSYFALLGDVYAHLSRTDDALEALKQAVRKSADDDQCYVSLVMEQLQAGAANSAQATVEDGLARIPVLSIGPLELFPSCKEMYVKGKNT
ncbi:MAG TPA: tetratricopeptide repeat protein [Candidatus Dormibacteraeota bacterium]|nr:tetratricopeptide repeat protein [Candidatus Dormibacteraeota bacterium]